MMAIGAPRCVGRVKTPFETTGGTVENDFGHSIS